MHLISNYRYELIFPYIAYLIYMLRGISLGLLVYVYL